MILQEKEIPAHASLSLTEIMDSVTQYHQCSKFLIFGLTSILAEGHPDESLQKGFFDLWVMLDEKMNRTEKELSELIHQQG